MSADAWCLDEGHCPSPHHSPIPNVGRKLDIAVSNVLGDIGHTYGISRQLKPQRRQTNVTKVKSYNKTPVSSDECPTRRSLPWRAEWISSP